MNITEYPCMAYITKAADPAAIGMVVKVDSPAVSSLGSGWLIEFRDVIAYENILTGIPGQSKTFICPDAWLRPITPPGLSIDTDVEAPIESGVPA